MRISNILFSILLCFFISGCETIKNLDFIGFSDNGTPSLGSETKNISNKKNTSSFTLSHSKLLSIIEEQRKLLNDIKKEKIGNAEKDSRFNNLEESWMLYLHENPKDVEATIIFAKFLKEFGMTKKAYEIFILADSMNPNIAVVKQQLSVIEGEIGDYKSSFKNIKNAISLDETPIIYHYQLVKLLDSYGTILELDKILKKGESDNMRMSHMKKVCELEPKNKQYNIEYASMLANIDSANIQECYRVWNILLTSSPLELDKDNSKILVSRFLIRKNKFDDAEKLLNEITRLELQESKQVLLTQIKMLRETETK